MSENPDRLSFEVQKKTLARWVENELDFESTPKEYAQDLKRFKDAVLGLNKIQRSHLYMLFDRLLEADRSMGVTKQRLDRIQELKTWINKNFHKSAP